MTEGGEIVQKLSIVKDFADKESYSSRISAMIFHYTNLPEAESLDVLKHTGVSAHFLVPQAQENDVRLEVINLVPLQDRAYHAGVSEWRSRKNLNDTSIGIEVVNNGFGFVQPGGQVLFVHHIDQAIQSKLVQQFKREGLFERLQTHHLFQAFLTEMLYGRLLPRDQAEYIQRVSATERAKYREITAKIREDLPDPFLKVQADQLYEWEKTGKIVWDTFSAQQTEAIILLAKAILKEVNLSPVAITGHADIAPSRKKDPGPKFPWKQLAEAGVGAWPDEKMVESIKETLRKSVPSDISITWLQTQLKNYGYGIPVTNVFDQATKEVLIAFQMHFRPQNYAGIPDIETCSILAALIQKYYPEKYHLPTERQ
jgi:N-acetyl-anhydromuramyl-L-alanine amidase AmpD